MRILSVTGPLHREFGGPPVAATGISTNLANLGNHVVVLICGQTREDIDINSTFFEKIKGSGAEIRILMRGKISRFGTFIRISEIRNLSKIIRNSDVIILHQIFQFQFVSIVPILIFFNKPYIVMPHGTLTTYQRKQHSIRKSFFFLFTYTFLKFASAIFVAHKQEKIQLPTYLKAKAFEVGLGIDLPTDINRIPKHVNKSFQLLYLGRITKKKRLEIALEAFALAAEKTKIETRFIVCGSGEESEVQALKELAKKLKIDARVEFRGWVDSSEKAQVLAESDCFILTSEDENFAIATAEALAHGIPCILSSKVALAALVEEFDAGIILKHMEINEVCEAIIRISLSGGENYRKSAYEAAMEISWESVSKKWEKCLKVIVGF